MRYLSMKTRVEHQVFASLGVNRIDLSIEHSRVNLGLDTRRDITIGRTIRGDRFRDDLTVLAHRHMRGRMLTGEHLWKRRKE
jgi:hypothetical protein